MDALDDHDKRVLARALSAIGEFRKLRHDMPLQYLTTFLLVAKEEGLTVNGYAERAKVSKSVMSRHLKDIGEANRHKKPGFKLVHSKTNPNNGKEKLIYLTDLGRAMASRMGGAIGN